METVSKAKPGRISTAERKSLKRDIRLSYQMFDSEAFKSLSGTGIRVLLRFLQKRTWSTTGRGSRKKTTYNNEGLVFTYGEAQAHGISQSQFHTILKRLVELGFIDIEHQGGWVGQDYSRYALSERWRDYGTPRFKAVLKKRVLQPGLDVKSWQARKSEKTMESRSYVTTENRQYESAYIQ